jgi:hypothetical protein
VIAGAAVIGSIAMVLVMRPGDSTRIRNGVPDPTGAAADLTRPEPRAAPIVEHIEEPNPPPAVPATDEPAAGAAAAADPAIAAASGSAAPARPGSPPSTRAGTAAGSTKPGSSRTVSRTASSAAHAARDIPRLYADARYDKVLAQCGGTLAVELAATCFLAACHLGDESSARRLLAAAPAARRDALVAGCKQSGLDLRKLDCEADPMACQH